MGEVNSNQTSMERRRSDRLFESVPLIVRGIDLLGQPFEERTGHAGFQPPWLPLFFQASLAQEYVDHAGTAAGAAIGRMYAHALHGCSVRIPSEIFSNCRGTGRSGKYLGA